MNCHVTTNKKGLSAFFSIWLALVHLKLKSSSSLILVFESRQIDVGLNLSTVNDQTFSLVRISPLRAYTLNIHAHNHGAR